MEDVDSGWHSCHFCGEEVKDGKTMKGESHLLQDCRPDLVEHEIGTTCTWYYGLVNGDVPPNETCYAYQALDGTWTDDHIHFYPKEAQT